MFSEYASRFLAQSNAQISDSRSPLDRRRYAQQRPTPTNEPSRFPFASRLSRPQQQDAPLFFSTTEDFPDDEDEQRQHEREVEDAFALQKSRQHFGRSNLTESSEIEDDSIERVVGGQNHDRDQSLPRRGRPPIPSIAMSRDTSMPDSEASSVPGWKGKGRLVDVNLASTINEEPADSLSRFSTTDDRDDPPTPFRTFKPGNRDIQQSSFMPIETDEEANLAMPHPTSPGAESVPAPTVILPAQEPPKHDVFWANMFQISLFAMFAAFVLIWFHTSAPTKSKPLGDTIYSALRGSTYMLLWDTMIAIFVALVWLALLRSYVRPLVFGMLATVPIILFSFSLYPLISSFKGAYKGSSYQDKAMRWFSLIPFVVAIVWTFNVIRSRHSLDRAIRILEFSTKILVASPHLVTLGFATLGVVVGWTWLWMLMFERLFLSGHFSSGGKARFIIDANSWWLGAFFVLQYLWTLGVIAGVQRATSAAVVSQWYFHRRAIPQPSSEQVVRASFSHAVGAAFGTICLSTFLSLLVRLPLIILPGRLAGLLNVCAYWIIPSGLATLTNPLTLTYAAIFSQPLGIAARGLGSMTFVNPTNPSNTMSTRPFRASSNNNGSTLISWRLSKLLLQATRYVMSFALGFSGWVRTARNLSIDGSSASLRGSLYAYVVGFVAATIGFAVLGAIENVVGAVLDAAVICWASETGGRGRGEARFCREAGELFGEEDDARF